MQMHVGRKLIPVVIAIGLAVMAARALWPSDARDIRRRLEVLADAVSAPKAETELERAARMVRVGSFFTDDVILRKDTSSFVGGRQAVLGLALQGAEVYGRMVVSLSDVDVALVDATNATVYMTLSISGDSPQAQIPDPRQVSVTLVKTRGEWLVSRGEVLRTLDTAK